MYRDEMPTSLLRRCQLLLATSALLAFGGCLTAPPIDGLRDAKSVPMEDSDLVPANKDPGRRTRIVVLASDDSPSAREAGLAAVASAAVVGILGTGGAEVVDRTMADRLDKELKLAEMKGTGSYGGPDVADYAIRVAMGVGNVKSEYRNASTFTDPLTKKKVNIAAGYSYTATSSMAMRIYALPTLRLVEQFPVEGKHTATQQPTDVTAVQKVGLLRSATEDGVSSKKNEVLNLFAPKGYITERRLDGKGSIFFVQLGKNQGAQAGGSLQIWSQVKVGDTLNEVPVGTAVVSNVINPDSSWIRIDDEKLAAKVKKYDYVKVTRGTKDSIMDKLPSFLK